MTLGRVTRLRRVVGSVLLVVGASMMGRAVTPSLRAALVQRELARAFSRGDVVLREGVELIPGVRLSIQAVGLDVVALRLPRGASAASALALAPVVQRPVPHGPRLISAHRDGPFASLAGLEEGDSVVLQVRAEGVRFMRVVAIQVVNPQDTRWLEDEGEHSVVLSTCYPFDALGPAPERFVVLLREEGEAWDLS